MPGRLDSKVAPVTAAGQGIRRANRRDLRGGGRKVIATDLDGAKLDGLAAAVRRALDVGGLPASGEQARLSEKDRDLSFDLNVKSMHRTVQA